MFSKYSFLVLISLLTITFSYTNALAQNGKLPPFRIMQTNGKVYKAEQLPIGKPIIVVYFDPECHDCQVFINNLLPQMNNFNKASIALITNMSINAVINFSDKYKINNYKNMVVGTEGADAFIGNYYHYPQLPFVALYDKNGNIITTYSKNIPINELSAKLKKL